MHHNSFQVFFIFYSSLLLFTCIQDVKKYVEDHLDRLEIFLK